MSCKQALYLIILVSVLSGCVSPVGNTPTSRPVEVQYDSIKFLGDMEANDTRFVMQGELLGCWEFDMGPANCRDVTIELYAENGTHLRTYRVGYLNGSTNVSIVAPVVPHYVLIRSPDFWGHLFTNIYYYERLEDGRYWARVIGERDEFPDAINVTGRG